MQALRIDDATPDRRAAVRDLVLAGLEARWGPLDPTRNRDLDDLAAAHPGSRTLIALDGDTVIATGTVVPRSGRHAEVVRMAVDDARRRQGVGRALLEELAAVAGRWGCTHLVLETTSTWHDAITFYERCGFHRTHEVPAGAGGTDAWFERPLA